MDITLKSIVVLIFITYHFNVELCQSYSKPTKWRNTRKSETPDRSLSHHWHRKQLEHRNVYDEQLKYIASMMKPPQTREAQQWQAAVEIQPKSGDRLSAAIQVGQPRLKTKSNHPSQTEDTVMVEKEHQRKSKHSKRLETKQQAKKNITLIQNSVEKETQRNALFYNRRNLKNDRYDGRRHNVKHRYEGLDDTRGIVNTFNLRKSMNSNVSHEEGNTNNSLLVGRVSTDHDKKNDHKVNIRYALNVELNQRLGDLIQNKVAAIKDKIQVLHNAGVPYLK